MIELWSEDLRKPEINNIHLTSPHHLCWISWNKVGHGKVGDGGGSTGEEERAYPRWAIG